MRDFEEVKSILDTMGTTVVLVGPPGSGQTVKAANQLIVAGTIELVAEAIVFLRAYGVDTDMAIARVLAGGLAGNQGSWSERPPTCSAGDFPARLPDRPASQGHGNRDRLPPAGARGCHPARRADGRARRCRSAPRGTATWITPRCSAVWSASRDACD